MFPYLILVGLAAMATGVLNSHDRFFAGAIGSAVLNVGMIAAVLLLARHVEPPIVSLAIGVLIGGARPPPPPLPGLSGPPRPVPPAAPARPPPHCPGTPPP